MRSLRGNLLKWLLGALALGALVLVQVAYVVTLDEMNEVLDQNLREVAMSVAQYHAVAQVVQPAEIPGLPSDKRTDDAELLTQVWQRDGKLLYSSNSASPVPFETSPGPHRLEVAGEEWRIYTVVLSDTVVQAAQRTTTRHQMAVESASKLFIPLACLIALIAMLLVTALQRGLRPLDDAAAEMARRNALSTEPIEASHMPREVQPLVSAFNSLMERLSDAFAMQGRFVADAAHELRSPITALQLQLKLLTRAPNADARALATNELQQGVDRAQRLVEQLLELSKAQPEVPVGRIETVRLDDLARSVVATFNPEAIERQMDLGASAPIKIEVQGDPVQLRTLVNNLVRNALRYCPAGSRIDVVAEFNNGVQTLRVIDNGPGITPSEIGTIFERFRRGSDAHVRHGDPAGSGLGLAIVRAIADRHGATVSLQPGEGGSGLEVRVRFSRSKEAS